MPRFNYFCDSCNKEHVLLRPKPSDTLCPDCKKIIKRSKIEPANTRIVEVYDNGNMSRRVVMPANAQQLYKERADKHK